MTLFEEIWDTQPLPYRSRSHIMLVLELRKRGKDKEYAEELILIWQMEGLIEPINIKGHYGRAQTKPKV